MASFRLEVVAGLTPAGARGRGRGAAPGGARRGRAPGGAGGERMPSVRLRRNAPTAETAASLWSEAGDGTDYYFAYGPQLDGVIGAYRRLTGSAPMMPAWAFGLWQSRERYETAQQSLDVVKGFRSRGIPFDNIVQDWRYWPEGTWGSHEFDPARFPDPDGWIKAIHELHAHLMISVWGKFDP